MRQHQYRSKFFILAENLAQRIAQLLKSSEKHLKLSEFFPSISPE
jgi:protein phosphatase-4 regulatory subunit 3